MSRKATITAEWKEYGLSTSLEVEAPDIPKSLSMSCKDIDDHGGWWFTADHYSSNNPLLHSYELTFGDDIGSTNQEIIDRINSGEMTLTATASNESGGLYPISPVLTFQSSSIYISIDDQKSSAYYILWNTRIATVTITLSWPEYNISTSYIFKVPPFGLTNFNISESLFTLPDNSSYDTYYRPVNEPIQLTLNSSFSSYQQYFQEWIDNGILKATGFLNKQYDNLHYKFIRSTYGTEWNNYLSSDDYTYTADFDDCDTWINQINFTRYFATTLQIIPVKSVYGDCDLVPFVYFNGQGITSGHKDPSYMIYDSSEYSKTVADMVSAAASARLSYSTGTLYNDEHGGDWNIGEMAVSINTSPTLLTTSSSGTAFTVGTQTGSDIFENAAFLMLGFGNAQDAQDFVNMTQAGLIYMTLTTNGSGSQLVQSTTATNDLPYNLQIPTSIRTRVSPSCFYVGGSALYEKCYIKNGPVSYGSYYYVILFYKQYNEPINTSNISQGVRLRFYNNLTGSYTQGSNPSYFYFNGNNTRYLYNILGWEL